MTQPKRPGLKRVIAVQIQILFFSRPRLQRFEFCLSFAAAEISSGPWASGKDL
ncbi:MAG: hypothetical protein AAF152_07610 [Cyanobacteria bacterium P01_A01_bin.114]